MCFLLPSPSNFRDLLIELKRLPLNTLKIRGTSNAPSTKYLRKKTTCELRELEVDQPFHPKITLAQYLLQIIQTSDIL